MPIQLDYNMNIDKLSSQNIQLVGLKATQSIKDVYIHVFEYIYVYMNCVYIIYISVCIVHILYYKHQDLIYQLAFKIYFF